MNKFTHLSKNTIHIIVVFVTAVLITISAFYGYTLYKQSKSTFTFTFIPHTTEECTGCKIEFINGAVTLSVQDKKNGLVAYKGFVIHTYKKYSGVNAVDFGKFAHIQFGSPDKKPLITLIGMPLKSKYTREQMIKKGYNMPKDGFGYVVDPRFTDMEGARGDFPIAWVIQEDSE